MIYFLDILKLEWANRWAEKVMVTMIIIKIVHCDPLLHIKQCDYTQMIRKQNVPENQQQIRYAKYNGNFFVF